MGQCVAARLCKRIKRRTVVNQIDPELGGIWQRRTSAGFGLTDAERKGAHFETARLSMTRLEAIF